MSTTTTFLFSLTSPPLVHAHSHSKTLTPHLHLRRHRLTNISCTPSTSSPESTGDHEYDELVSRYRRLPPQTEDEARRDNWINRGWAPWEEILSPEAAFARHSIDEGEEVPLENPKALEAFRMLTPSYRRKAVEESGLTEAELFIKLFAIKTEFPDPIETTWAGPLKFRLVPPRDWPPRGWEVDEKELEFIREAHRMQSVRVDVGMEEEGMDVEVKEDGEELDKEVSLERYRVFLKQYKEWVAANKDRLEEESYKVYVIIHFTNCLRGVDTSSWQSK